MPCGLVNTYSCFASKDHFVRILGPCGSEDQSNTVRRNVCNCLFTNINQLDELNCIISLFQASILLTNKYIEMHGQQNIKKNVCNCLQVNMA